MAHIILDKIITKTHEPAHEKTKIRLIRPAKTQIWLRKCAVWSECSLIACTFYGLRAIQRGIN